MKPGDWLSLAYERFQSATRSIRLTLPPGQDREFWDRILELSRIKQKKPAITLLLDPDLKHADALQIALSALPFLEQDGYEISWSAIGGFPFHLMIVDDFWAAVMVKDPDDPTRRNFLVFVAEGNQAVSLREKYDRFVSAGHWDIDPQTWLEWLDNLHGRSPARRTLGTMRRSEERLSRIVRKALHKMPSRSCWLVKPRDSAYGLPEPPGRHHWNEWKEENYFDLGWTALTLLLPTQGMPSRGEFKKWIQETYSKVQDFDRTYAVCRHFISDMIRGDRVAAVDGWTSRQTATVRFHGWTQVELPVQKKRKGNRWLLIRPAQWHCYEIDLPVALLREATGLQSATHPIHQIDKGAFRNLLALAEEIKRNWGEKQLLMELSPSNP